MVIAPLSHRPCYFRGGGGGGGGRGLGRYGGLSDIVSTLITSFLYRIPLTIYHKTLTATTLIFLALQPLDELLWKVSLEFGQRREYRDPLSCLAQWEHPCPLPEE